VNINCRQIELTLRNCAAEADDIMVAKYTPSVHESLKGFRNDGVAVLFSTRDQLLDERRSLDRRC